VCAYLFVPLAPQTSHLPSHSFDERDRCPSILSRQLAVRRRELPLPLAVRLYTAIGRFPGRY
jgi:hypothetical protein